MVVWQPQRWMLSSPSKVPTAKNIVEWWPPVTPPLGSMVGSCQDHTSFGQQAGSDTTAHYGTPSQWAAFAPGLRNWPGQDIFKTVLKFRVLLIKPPSFFLFFHRCQAFLLVWRLTPCTLAPSLLILQKYFPQPTIMHIEFCPEVCFLEEGAHKKESIFLLLLASNAKEI